jgi:hypothetical protein
MTEAEILQSIATLMEYALAYRSCVAINMKDLLLDPALEEFYEEIEQRHDNEFLVVMGEYRVSGRYFIALDHACNMFQAARKAYYAHFLDQSAADLF